MSLTPTIRASVLLTALTSLIATASAQSPIIIDYPGATSKATYGFAGTAAFGINNNGEIVGAYYDAETTNTDSRTRLQRSHLP